MTVCGSRYSIVVGRVGGSEAISAEGPISGVLAECRMGGNGSMEYLLSSSAACSFLNEASLIGAKGRRLKDGVGLTR